MEDVPAMLALQEDMLAALEDPAWYFPSEEWEFVSAVQGQEAWGCFDGDRLAGFAVMTPGDRRGEHSYAAMLDEPVEGSFDFHDLMVAPAMRRRGIHTAFLKLFAAMAAEDGGRAVYCTVDPGNGASWRNFERAGYRVVCTRPAYDGRMRRFYRLDLTQE
jgi:ribosomal protein S18 acetylase RimI-like enzyme